jgi:hypothetical protein
MSRIAIFVPGSTKQCDLVEFLVKVGRAVTGYQVHDDGVDIVFGVDHAAMTTIGQSATSYGFTVGGRTALPAEAEAPAKAPAKARSKRATKDE